VETAFHDLPDFVYFDHSIHIAKGVGCSTCHGANRSDAARAPERRSCPWQWCLECHRAPERFLRPKRADLPTPSGRPPPDQDVRGKALRETYKLRTTRELTGLFDLHR
jgi:hypothetical protein